MGAFDGLNLYQRRPQTYVSSSRKPEPENKEFYVSWDWVRSRSSLLAAHTLSGATGKWFPSKDEAIKCFFEKISEGVHPACWFKDERVDDVSNDCNDPSCPRCKFKKAR